MFTVPKWYQNVGLFTNSWQSLHTFQPLKLPLDLTITIVISVIDRSVLQCYCLRFFQVATTNFKRKHCESRGSCQRTKNNTPPQVVTTELWIYDT